jgi:threonine/homoserine/homoserine lactone efflux protein
VYLIGLGIYSLRSAFRARAAASPAPDQRARGGLRSHAAFRQGVISNLGNPKMAVV